MIGGRRVLAVIPARGGSKGLPGKNIARVGGRPLLDWTVRAAHGAARIDRTVVSTDDEGIAAVARALGCEVPFLRPPALATDTAATVDVVLHALRALPGHDVVVVLQPTSPLRTASDIEQACALWQSRGAPTCASVAPVVQSPYWMYRLDERGCLQAVLETPAGVSRRQDLPEVFALNGAIYVADAAWLQTHRRFVGADTVAYVMPAQRSLDIDTAADLQAFEREINEETHVQIPPAP